MRLITDILWCAVGALILFVLACLLVDPAGATTIGREYAPFAAAIWGFIALAVYITASNIYHLIKGD